MRIELEGGDGERGGGGQGGGGGGGESERGMRIELEGGDEGVSMLEGLCVVLFFASCYCCMYKLCLQRQALEK